MAELTPDEPPGSPAAEPAAVEPGSGSPPTDSGQVAPGNDAVQTPSASNERPADELSGRALPGRVPQWLARLADSLENARSRLDTATSAPAPGLVPPASPAPHRVGSTAGLGG